MPSDEISTDLLKEVEITKHNNIRIPNSVYDIIISDEPGPTYAMWYISQTGSTEYLYITDVMFGGADSTFLTATQVSDKNGGVRSRVRIPKAAMDRKDLQPGQSLYFFLRENEAEEENPSATLLTKQQLDSFLNRGINESSETEFAHKFTTIPHKNLDY